MDNKPKTEIEQWHSLAKYASDLAPADRHIGVSVEVIESLDAEIKELEYEKHRLMEVCKVAYGYLVSIKFHNEHLVSSQMIKKIEDTLNSIRRDEYENKNLTQTTQFNP